MKTIIILLLLITTSPSFAQMDDSSLLESLTGGMQTSKAKSDKEDEAADDRAKPETEEKVEINFEDPSYGYTGGKSFKVPPQSKFSTKPLSYFGYDFFIDAPTTFAQVKNAPVPPDYVLGPNDRVKVNFYGSIRSFTDERISRDGDIFIPEIGPVMAAGLTFREFKESLNAIIENQLIGTKANITLGSLRSIDIFVLGEALQPGMYNISALSTLVNAVIKSGGVAPTGSLRNIQLKRNGKVVSYFDFYDLLLKGDTSNDKRLMQGDVVFIPPITKTVGISGQIARPGIYELSDDETLKDLINFAGSLKPKADLLSVDLQRVEPLNDGYNLMQINLNNDLKLKNGDVLSIHPVADNLKNAILVSGHAKQPGFAALTDGMRIGELLSSQDDLLAMTDLNYVLVKREDKETNDIKFLQVDLEDVFQDKESESNILLSEKDEVLLLPSLLTPDVITTRLIEDDYTTNEKGEIVMVNEWNSPTYLRKSLMQEAVFLEEANLNEDGGFSRQYKTQPTEGQGKEGSIMRYYEYSIYDYCSLPEDLAISTIESSGFRAKKSVPLEDLGDIKTPQDILDLQEEIEDERAAKSDSSIAVDITLFCREQLLKPFVEIIERQIDEDGEEDIISVYGNVHFPGDYPLTNNMDLADAIKAAGGQKNSTYSSEIELSRSDVTGQKISVYNSIASYSNKNSMNMKLKERDIVNLKEISNNVKTVEITGEVFFAGTYPISENQTINELINRAGGLTEYASPNAARFIRKSLQESEMQRLENARSELKRKIVLSSQAAGLGENPLSGGAINQLTSLLTEDTSQDEALGRLVINLDAIMDGYDVDIILEDGDKLHIPKVQQTISVLGEVYVPNTHVFKSNLGINDYINLSGGANEFADSNTIYIVKSDGSIVSPDQLSKNGFFRASSSILENGDTIVVPLTVKPFSAIRATTEVTQIIYQMALAAAAVNSF